MTTTGRAYGFFNCNQPKAVIEAELPYLRTAVGTPSDLELTLIEGLDNLEAPEGLRPIVAQAREYGIQYVLEARYNGATHQKTAGEVAAIFNQAYNSDLYETGEAFDHQIVYQRGDKYVFRRKLLSVVIN